MSRSSMSLSGRMKKAKGIPSWASVSRWEVLCWSLRCLLRWQPSNPLVALLAVALGILLVIHRK